MMRIALATALVGALALPGLALAQEAQTTVTASQPVPNPPPATTERGPGTADTMYSGALKGQAFLDVDARMAAMDGKVGGNKRAAAMLRGIKGEAKVRRARHGGELRDWDRELLNKKLDQLDGMVGGAG